MPKLFIKIFLSFWLLVTWFSATTFVAISEQVASRHARLREAAPLERIAESIAAAQAAADRGLPALQAWLRETNDSEPVPVFLLDEHGRDLLGRELPAYLDGARRRIEFLPGIPEAPPTMRSKALFLAMPGMPVQVVRDASPLVTLQDGTRYLFLPDFGGVTIGRLIAANAALVMSWFLAMLLSSGLVCFWLARHVTSPLKDLRALIHRWGSGKLAERSAPHIGARNDEFADLARELDDMAARLQALIDSQQQLLSDVSHELGSPLTRLVMAAALLRRRFGMDAFPELDRIEQEAALLGSNIERILFVAKLEAEKGLAARVPVDIGALARKSVDGVALLYPDDAPDIRFCSDGRSIVRGDPGLLRIALDNVLLNAVKYGRREGPIEVEVVRDGSAVSVHVRDEGPGVPASMLQRIFERFVRVDPARHASTGGLGLGLAIAKHAVHLHDGSIVARNRALRGLEVVMSLPLRE